MYSEDELRAMDESIESMKPYCDGFVFGILKKDKTIDVEACSRMVRAAKPLPCTFHRAFDETPILIKGLVDVANCSFATVLTSGGPGNAMDNIPYLAVMMTSSLDNLAIMPGGGIRAVQIDQMRRNGVDAEWFHSSAIVDGDELADEQELHSLCLAVRVNDDHQTVVDQNKTPDNGTARCL